MRTSDRIRFGRYSPKGSTRAGRLLALGSLTVTVTSRRSGQHITLRFRAKIKDAGQGRWSRCGFAEASHVFVTARDGDLLATYYPKDGVLRFEANVSPAVRWSVQAVLRHLSGAFPEFERIAEIHAARPCGRCRRPLFDPESIERGFGPECFGMPTGSRAVAARAA